MSIIKKNPKRRFKECNDDWERRKVGDTITDVSRPVELKDNELYQLVTVKRRNEGIVSRGKLLGKDILVKNYYEVCAGDYVISKRQLIHGANGVIPQELDKSVVSNEYMVCVSNDKITAEFLGWLSKTPGLKRDFFLSSYGVDVEKMVFNADDWKKRYLTIPSVDEQNKITSYLSNLDNLIALHQRKLDKLTCLKKAYLSEMFPAPGEKKPRRRFPGFTGYWEQRKLGDVVGVCSGRDYKHLDDGDIPVYGTGGYMLSVSEALSEKDDAIGIGRKGTIDNPYILKAPFWTVDTLFYCVPKSDYDLNFVYATYQTIDWKSMDESTGVPSLSKTAINAVSVMVPSKQEQIKIGHHFSNIDNLITLHQRKLDKLMALKRAYLAEMFV